MTETERGEPCPLCRASGICAECRGVGTMTCASCDGLGCRECQTSGVIMCVPCDAGGRCWRCFGSGRLLSPRRVS